MMKSQISKVPESDQKEFNDAKETVGNLAGGGMQNPLGEFVSLAIICHTSRNGKGMNCTDENCVMTGWRER